MGQKITLERWHGAAASKDECHPPEAEQEGGGLGNGSINGDTVAGQGSDASRGAVGDKQGPLAVGVVAKEGVEGCGPRGGVQDVEGIDVPSIGLPGASELSSGGIDDGLIGVGITIGCRHSEGGKDAFVGIAKFIRCRLPGPIQEHAEASAMLQVNIVISVETTCNVECNFDGFDVFDGRDERLEISHPQGTVVWDG